MKIFMLSKLGWTCVYSLKKLESISCFVSPFLFPPFQIRVDSWLERNWSVAFHSELSGDGLSRDGSTRVSRVNQADDDSSRDSRFKSSLRLIRCDSVEPRSDDIRNRKQQPQNRKFKRSSPLIKTVILYPVSTKNSNLFVKLVNREEVLTKLSILYKVYMLYVRYT